MSAATKVPLSRVVSKTTGGGTPERDNEEYWNGGIPWATVKDFKDGVYELKAIKEEISEKGLSRSSSHLIPAGTPIICTRMAVGRIARASFPVAINQDLRALYIREDFDTDYVVSAIDSIRHRIENVSVGSTVKGISLDQLLAFEIDAPSKPEQTKIAEILSTVDRAIEQTEALIAKQQRLKTGLMQDLLTRGIDEHGRIRSEETHEFKDSPMGRIPVEWEVEEFSHYIDSIDSGWSPVCLGRPADYGECGSLKTTSVSWAGYDPRENKALPSFLVPIPKYFTALDDILITRVGPRSRIGIVAHVDLVDRDLMISDNMLRIKLARDRSLIPAFVPILLGSAAIQNNWDARKVGLAEAQMVITQRIVINTLISVPGKLEQNAIVERHTSITELLSRHAECLEKLLTLKSSLMQDLMTGRKRVTDLLVRKAETQ